MEDALHNTPLYREFTHLNAGIKRLPDVSTILHFHRMIKEHQPGMKILAAVNAKLIDRSLM
jgi:IS5 family transposase